MYRLFIIGVAFCILGCASSQSIFTQLHPEANSCQTTEVVNGFLAAADFTICWDDNKKITQALIPGVAVPPVSIIEEPVDTAIGTTLIVK